jgi:hypothetical protein
MVDEQATIRLWTWQGPRFDITTAGLDLSKSPYARFGKYQPSVRRLCDMLGVPNVVWCTPHREEHVAVPGATEEQWELQVPRSEIVAVVNNHIWNRILGRDGIFPIGCVERWRHEAFKDAPSNPVRQEQLLRERESAHARRFSDDRLWDHLFIDDPDDDFADVLLRYPIDREWVVRPMWARGK